MIETTMSSGWAQISPVANAGGLLADLDLPSRRALPGYRLAGRRGSVGAGFHSGALGRAGADRGLTGGRGRGFRVRASKQPWPAAARRVDKSGEDATLVKTGRVSAANTTDHKNPPRCPSSRRPKRSNLVPTTIMCNDTDIQEAIASVRDAAASLASDEGRNTASGVFFRRGTGRFVATARHFITAISDINSLRIVSASRPFAETAPGIRSARATNDQQFDHDVAVLQLADDEAEEIAPRWIAEAQIRSGVVMLNEPVWIVGFPSETIRSLGTSESPVGEAMLAILATSVTQERLNGDPAVFLAAFRPPEAAVDPSSSAIRDPHGMSGGGVFAVFAPREGAFSIQDRVRLVGIQTAVVPFNGAQVLTCTRSESVLALADAALHRAQR